MATRLRRLPAGWYPEDGPSIEKFLSQAALSPPVEGAGEAYAAVAPHAGWTFSGQLAARSVASLRDAQTVVVVGGHLTGLSAPLAAIEESFETPLGPMAADLELREELASELGRMSPPYRLREDEISDNSVEVQLPLVRRRYPKARLLWLRAPNGAGAIELGRALARAADRLRRRLAVIGSTDLSHYGPTYGFEPKGRGRAAEAWVREVNDARFIESLLAMDPAEALRRGEQENSACSGGAAAAALSFALASGATRAGLLGYATSLEVRQDQSFVGYASVGFF